MYFTADNDGDEDSGENVFWNNVANAWNNILVG